MLLSASETTLSNNRIVELSPLSNCFVDVDLPSILGQTRKYELTITATYTQVYIRQQTCAERTARARCDRYRHTNMVVNIDTRLQASCEYHNAHVNTTFSDFIILTQMVCTTF